MYVRKGVEEEVKEEVDDLEQVDEDVTIAKGDGSNEEVEHDCEAEKSTESEVLTGAERT
jgi:hypothetical protein